MKIKMQDSPIGVFDSGLGGLTAAKEIIKIMPNENIVYFGDTNRVPYGSKKDETIINYALQDINFLMSRNVKFIVAACGTVSSVISNYESLISVPFTGVLYPACLAAIKASKSLRIGVIGTSATIKSNSYKINLCSINPKVNVVQQACPLFAPMIENGFISPDDSLVKETVKKHLSVFEKYDIDTLILGCTHYPIISKAIQNFMGQSVTLIDSGKETAIHVKKALKSLDLMSKRKSRGKCEFFVSGSVENFSRTAGLFLGYDIASNVYKVDIN